MIVCQRLNYPINIIQGFYRAIIDINLRFLAMFFTTSIIMAFPIKEWTT